MLVVLYMNEQTIKELMFKIDEKQHIYIYIYTQIVSPSSLKRFLEVADFR